METKVCSRCGRELPATTEYFSKQNRNKSGFRPDCKECVKQYRILNKDKSVKYKKEYYALNKDKIAQDSKEYRELNKDKFAQRNKDYQKSNKEHLSEYRKQYNEKNKEIRKEYGKQYKKEHKEYFTEYYRKRCKENIEYIRINRHKRDARLRDLPNTFTFQQWELCIKYFNYKCAYCGSDGKLTQDHFIPVIKGGGYEIYNIIPACSCCNSSKGIKLLNDWYPNQPFYSEEREENILTYLEIIMNENNNQNTESTS